MNKNFLRIIKKFTFNFINLLNGCGAYFIIKIEFVFATDKYTELPIFAIYYYYYYF